MEFFAIFIPNFRFMHVGWEWREGGREGERDREREREGKREEEEEGEGREHLDRL